MAKINPDIVNVEPYWYDENDCLGSGAFGEVYKGHSDQDKNLQLAIKRIPKRKLPKNIIDQEIQILQELSGPDVQHENFVTLLDCIQTDKNVYLIMEYCNGGDLDHYLKKKGKMDETSLRAFLQQIASGLKILHDHNVVHRDLKPANILISYNGTHDISHATFKIADFGMGRFLDEGAAAQTFCGTPVFMAPEFFFPKAQYDYKVDLWSVGAIVYNCFTGALYGAFQKEPLRLPSNTSPNLKDLMTKLLCSDPKARLSFDDFYYHPFIGMKELEEKQKLMKSKAGGIGRSPSIDEGTSWLRRTFSIRRKSIKADEKVKAVFEGHVASSNPSSPTEGANQRSSGYYSDSPENAPSPPPPAQAVIPRKAKAGALAFPRMNSPVMNPIQEAISIKLISALEVKNHNIYGITHLDSRFYVLCRSQDVLLQYADQPPFIRFKDTDLSEFVKLPQDVAGCNISNCLYAMDIERNCVWKVELNYRVRVKRWASEISAPHTLSVSAKNGQVTTFGNRSKSLNVYSKEARFLYAISLPSDVKFPQHAVETSKGTFIVSYGDHDSRKHGVFEVNSKGKILTRYEHKTEKLNHPVHLAIDSDDKVFVADNINNRVLLLDNNLKLEQIFTGDEKNRMDKPFRVCYTLIRGQKRLIVEYGNNIVGIFNVS